MSMIRISTGMVLLLLCTFIMDTETARCCFSYTQRAVRCSRLKGYSIQEITGNCDIRAIIFKTRSEKSICADPKKKWTQERVTCLRKKAAVMGVSLK